LRFFPCFAVDVGSPFLLCGLPYVFQDLLSPSIERLCPHCLSLRSSLSSTAHVSALLLCLLCGSYVCATSRARCHLAHVQQCEGECGVFLSLKRADCVLLKIQKPITTTTARTSRQRNITPTHPISITSTDISTSSTNANNSFHSLTNREGVRMPSSIPIRLAAAASSSPVPPAPPAPPAPPVPPVPLILSLPVVSPSYSFCHWPSLYLDRYGESDLNLSRGKPLYRNQQRVKTLTQLLTTGAIHDFIAQHAYIRPTTANPTTTTATIPTQMPPLGPLATTLTPTPTVANALPIPRGFAARASTSSSSTMLPQTQIYP